MKKLLFIFIMMFVLTGCSNAFTFEFKEDKISSTIEVQFSDSEYKSYQEKYGIEYDSDVFNKTSVQSLIKDTYDDSSAIAYKSDNGKYFYYTPLSYDRTSTNNKFIYTYDYTYDNFKLNHYINECFEYFTSTEDDNYYYYQISGAFTCENENNLTFNIKANNRIAESNSDEKNDDTHSWNIRKNENDIYFIISKNELRNETISKFTIISFVIIFVLVIVVSLLYKKVNKTY